ncbi:hypothetical protein LCGC14_0684640 [marine sediment metagenome]|uniref:Portal protein n=1 Tax=marine sediment metagenome TaxID=412755 RepID=A0A0F9TVA1_9ZZZZ
MTTLATTSLDKTKNRMTELKSLHDRMDRTRDRVYNTPYVMPDLADPTHKMDNVISVTMPYGAIIANTVINDLMTSFRQTIVSGSISAKTQRLIEGFIDDNREEADERLANSNWHATLFEIWCSHVCIRSYIGVRWVSQIIDGKYVIDVKPIDMRYAPWEYGNDGLNWMAPISFRTRAELEAQYAEVIKEKKVSLSGESTQLFEVRDYWDSAKKELWINKVLALEQKNPLGEVPFVIGAPATGFMLRDEKYIEHDAEDILYLIRGVLDEMNRTASIEQTKGAETIRPPYEQLTDKVPDSSPADAPPTTSQTKKAQKDLGWKLLQTPDINNAFLTGRADLAKVLQMGGVNDIDLGNVSQTVSAVWITAQAGIRKKFSGPRLKAITQGDQQLARMMIRQTQNAVELEEGSPDIVVGGMGRKRTYAADKLGDPKQYAIRIELRSQSKTEEIANLVQFESAPDLPYEWRLEHILGANDPREIIRMKANEDALELDPAQKFADLGLKLAREAEESQDEQEKDVLNLRSMMNIERAVTILKQRLQPAPLPEGEPKLKPSPKGSPRPLVDMPSLLGPGDQALPRQQEEVPAV